MNSGLDETVAHLRSLGARKPTEPRFAEVRAALDSKYEGVRSVALSVLSAWGDRQSVETIKSFIDKARFQPAGWAIRGVALKAFLAVLGPDDHEWALDHFFLMHERGEPTTTDWTVLDRLPRRAVEARLKRERTSSSERRRIAAFKGARRLGIALPD